MNNSNRIRIALQKSGRLSEQSFNLLKRCGIQVRIRPDQLFFHCENFPLDILLVRDDDIPSLVAKGICEYGIVGTNLLKEKELQHKNLNITVISYLNFANCRLSIALPKYISYQNLSCLNGKIIATTYPTILADFFKRNSITAEITTLSGAVEIAPRLNIADGICDLVSTGATLEANNLHEVATVFTSQAVLIKSPHCFNSDKKCIADILQNRIDGSELANGSKYIMLHAPKTNLEQIVSLLPGAERPTIMDLQGNPEKLVLHALCRESIFWETMENLKQAGASSILVLPIEKMLA